MACCGESHNCPELTVGQGNKSVTENLSTKFHYSILKWVNHFIWKGQELVSIVSISIY